jgi:hypothetical protein
MKSLGESLKGWSPIAGAPADPVLAIGSRWPELVGGSVAANSRPLKIERGVLTVVTRSSAWSQQLSFLAERILTSIATTVPAAGVERLTFKVGRLAAPRSRPAAAAPGSGGQGGRLAAFEPAVDTAAAVARFRARVEAFWRAKQAAGWNPCPRCGVPLAPGSASHCGVCADARIGERTSAVMRLLYEMPLIGFEAARESVPDLGRSEFGAIRSRLLKRWWTVLQRAVREGKLTRDGRERAIAQSYVMLKSGVTADRLAPATVRNELGDELYALIYDTKTERNEKK